MRLQAVNSALAAALISMSIGMATTAAEGTITGWLEVKGERVALTHVFAAMQKDSLAEGEKQIVAVMLSDQPVPEALRRADAQWEFWASEQAVAGKIRGIILVIDPETKVWSRGQRLTTNGLTFYSHTSTDPASRTLRFDPASAGQAEIAGKAWMMEAMRGMDENDGPWRIEATFRTPVLQMAAVTAKLTGAQAKASPQYKTVMAFLDACKRKDLEGIRKTMDADSQAMLAKMVEAQGRAGALDMLAGMATDSLTMKAVEVVVRGETADVKLMNNTGKERNEHTLKVALDAGVWKMSR